MTPPDLHRAHTSSTWSDMPKRAALGCLGHPTLVARTRAATLIAAAGRGRGRAHDRRRGLAPLWRARAVGPAPLWRAQPLSRQRGAGPCPPPGKGTPFCESMPESVIRGWPAPSSWRRHNPLETMPRESLSYAPPAPLSSPASRGHSPRPLRRERAPERGRALDAALASSHLRLAAPCTRPALVSSHCIRNTGSHCVRNTESHLRLTTLSIAFPHLFPRGGWCSWSVAWVRGGLPVTQEGGVSTPS